MLRMKRHSQLCFLWNHSSKNKLNEHLPTILNMFSQPFFILENFMYNLCLTNGRKPQFNIYKLSLLFSYWLFCL
jgi:hypothetical protein